MNNTSNLQAHITEMLQIYDDTLKNLKNERNSIDGGRLIVNRQPGGIFFYEKNPDSMKGITKNMDRVHMLGRAQYLDGRIAVLEQERAQLRQLKSIMVQGYDAKAVMDRFYGSRFDVRHALMSGRNLKRTLMESQNPYMTEYLKYKTDNGRMVRSISEMKIANFYESHNVPHQYERELIIDVTGMNGIEGTITHNGRQYKKYYPDFTLFRLDGGIMLHEHMGLPDEKEYREKAGEKITVYTKSGVVTPARLILTYPEDIENFDSFISYAEQYILPYV